MNDLDVRSGPNRACAHAGLFADLGRDRSSHPALPRLARGKRFLKEPLGMTGAEVPLNVLPPGREMPSCHRPRANEGLDHFIGGTTSDGQAVPHCPHRPDPRRNATGEATHKDPEDAQA